ncbi:MAG: oligosaccharide flippase family protein [Flavobacteriales bacterium]|nr:oligosaccharide flippase family protein [Flavobacteriales bacterium]
MSKDILKNSIVYTILGFLPLALAFVFTPIYLTYMGNEQYGVLSLFLLYSSLFSHIIGLGIGRGFLFFYWDVYKDKLELKKLISSTLGLLLTIQILFISIGIYFSDSILSLIQSEDSSVDFYPFYLLALFQGGFLIYYEMFCYFYRNQEKLKEYAILNVGTLILFTLGSIIGVIILDLEALGAAYGRTIGYAVLVMAFILVFIKKYGISLDLKYSKVLLIFSLPLFLNSFIGALGYGIDKILIEKLDKLENLGVYSLALVFVSILEIWLNSINNALNPTLYRYLNEKIDTKQKEIQGIVYFIITSVFVLIVSILALIYPVLELMIPQEYHQVTTYFPVLALAFVWRVFTAIVTNALYIKKKTKLFLFNETTVLISVVLFGYLGYLLFGIIGIPFAIYISKVLEFLLMNYLSRKTLKLPIQLNRFFVFTIILSVVAFLCTYLDKKGVINNYLLYLFPLFTMILFYPILLKTELKMIYVVVRDRKELFKD